MKKTRKLFVLFGADNDVNEALEALSCRYKALIAVNSVTESDINAIFSINKSIACSQESVSKLPCKLIKEAISIKVRNNWSIMKKSEIDSNFINVDLESIPNQFKIIADKHNCDIGDETSNVFKLKGKNVTENCNFCNNFSSKTENKIIYMNNNFFVMPALGGFLKGYLLIVPKIHVFSIANLTKELRSDFLKVLSDIKYILNLTYNTSDFLIWENGSNRYSKNIAHDSITHATIHILPTSTVNSSIIKEKYNVPLVPISFDQINNYSNTSYLLLKSYNEGWEICSNPLFYIPRQFIRQVLAERNYIPNDQWNWKVNPLVDSLTKTANDISTALQANWFKLPEHIKENTKNYL